MNQEDTEFKRSQVAKKKPLNKTINAFFISEKTPVKVAVLDGSPCIAFDFGGRYLQGWAPSTSQAAELLAAFFANAAKRLKEKESPLIVPPQPEIVKP